MDLTRRHFLAVLLAAPLAAEGQAQGGALTKAQENRLRKFLPRTTEKLLRRAPVYVAVCGDEISAFAAPGSVRTPGAHVMAWYGRFLDRLGAAFHYHGGVVDMHPPEAGAGAALAKQWEQYRKLRAAWEKSRKGDAPPLPGVPEETADGPDRFLSVSDLLRLTQPAEGRVPATNAFYAANYAAEGAVAVQVLDPLRSLVFHAEEAAATDLVIIGCGARDALEGASLAAFRTVLESAVAECRARKVDVILGGPPPAQDEADERAGAGRARPWAAVMREVAEATGVFFADLGAAALYQPSDLMNRTPEDSCRAALAPVRAMFDHGPAVKNGFHPNAASHVRMGEVTAGWLLNGEPARPFEITGTLDLSFNAEGDRLTLSTRNKLKEPLTVAVCPLRFTGWAVQPGWPDKMHTFDPAQGAHRFRWALARTTDPLPGHEPFIRGSVIVSDDEAQHLVDVKVTLKPLVLLWPEERVDGAGGDHLLKCTLMNTGETLMDAGLTLLWMGQETALPGVKLAPGESEAVLIRLPLPAVDGAVRFKETVTVKVAAGDKVWPFTRRIEGVRHLGLGMKFPLVALSRWRARPAVAEPAPGDPQLRVTADQSAIYFHVSIPSSTVGDTVEGKAWGRLEVQLDGRKAGQNGTPGCTGSIVTDFTREDSAGRVRGPVRVSVFGYGQPSECVPASIRTRIETGPDGTRSIQFNMKRANLMEHEWSLDGAGQNDLGINVRLYLCDKDTGGSSEAKSWVLTASSFPAADARSLTLLELRADPAARWSLRIG